MKINFYAKNGQRTSTTLTSSEIFIFNLYCRLLKLPTKDFNLFVTELIKTSSLKYKSTEVKKAALQVAQNAILAHFSSSDVNQIELF